MVTAFFSYRHETDAHRDKVRALASQLESEGITVVLDQFAQAREFHGGGPHEGWPRWSKNQAGNAAHKVLIVASSGWFKCFEGTEVPDVGLGAAAEARVIEQRLYNTKGISADIRIVYFERTDLDALPLELQGYHHFHLPEKEKELVSWLKGISAPSVITGPAIWPDAPPLLAWPVADHRAVRDAFSQLITSGSPHRLLPIRGASDTGKSLITKQILRNAQKVPGLAYGRMDFKGTSDVANAVSIFVQHLKIEAPASSLGLVGQLGKIFADLNNRAQPALLVFDTFELAGEGERWIRENLLPRLSSTDWLRVVIAGQSVPKCHSEHGDYCCPIIDLLPPTPEDWFEYGLENKRTGIDLEFVSKVHALCGGNSTMLAQMLGPIS